MVLRLGGCLVVQTAWRRKQRTPRGRPLPQQTILAPSRIMRGGSWEELPEELRCADRAANRRAKREWNWIQGCQNVCCGEPPRPKLTDPQALWVEAASASLLQVPRASSSPSSFNQSGQPAGPNRNQRPRKNGQILFSDPKAGSISKTILPGSLRLPIHNANRCCCQGTLPKRDQHHRVWVLPKRIARSNRGS